MLRGKNDENLIILQFNVIPLYQVPLGYIIDMTSKHVRIACQTLLRKLSLQKDSNQADLLLSASQRASKK